jgi:hypothetical protein
MTVTRPDERTIVDAEGVRWTVSEAYLFDVSLDASTAVPKLAVLWFETASGRTASVYIPPGALEVLNDEDLLELLRVGTERRGRQP